MPAVKVILSGPLRRFYRTPSPGRGEWTDMPEGSVVADLLAAYGLSADKAHLILVGRHRALLQTPLEEGVEIRIVPLAIGG